MLVVFFVLLWIFWNVYAEWEADKLREAQAAYEQAKNNAEWSTKYADTFDIEWNYSTEWQNQQNQAYDQEEAAYDKLDKAGNELNTAKRNLDCANSWTCIDKSTFKIWVNETIWVWFKVEWDTSQVINRTLGTVIQKLMIALWVLAVLIMTIWGGYIILYHGQDELLSKGKSIFMSGVTSLVVALSSYYIVAILRYILYK